MSTVSPPAVGNVVTVRKNSGADVGTRARLNIIEGANMTATIVDDAVDGEIDITLASAGGGGADWVDQFFPAVDPQNYKGTYPGVLMPDTEETSVYQTFMIPSDIAAIVTAVVIIIPNASGNIRRSATTNFAAVCSNEDYQTHTDSIAAGEVAVDIEEVECLDISAALTGGAGGDLVGIRFIRHGDHANDTIGADVYYLGILIQGTT